MPLLAAFEDSALAIVVVMWSRIAGAAGVRRVKSSRRAPLMGTRLVWIEMGHVAP